MSVILKPGEVNKYGILIEHDAGYVEPALNSHILTEGILDIKKIDENKPIVDINCILQKWGVENKNGRIYPKEILIPQVDAYQQLIANNSAVSEADHPDSSVVSLHNLSHLITKMWWGTGDQEHILFGQLRLIISPGFLKHGICSVVGDKIMLYMMNYGIQLGISSRGVGSLKDIKGKNIVQNDFELICFDLVASPSTPGAYLFPDKNQMDIQENLTQSNLITNINNKPSLIEGNSSNQKVLSAINKFLIK